MIGVIAKLTVAAGKEAEFEAAASSQSCAQGAGEY